MTEKYTDEDDDCRFDRVLEAAKESTRLPEDFQDQLIDAIEEQIAAGRVRRRA